MAGRADQYVKQIGVEGHGSSLSLNYTPAVRPLPPSLTGALERDGRGVTVLVIRLSALGDVLRTLPAVRLLRRALSEARIFWVVEEHFGAVLLGHPDLDGVLALPRRRWTPMVRAPGKWRELLRGIGTFRDRLRSEHPDLVLDFHGNLRSGVTGWLSGAPVRLGYAGHQQKEGNRWFTTHRRPSGNRRVSRIERNLDLIRGLGIRDRPLSECDLPLVKSGTAGALRILRELGSGAGRYAVVNPGASLKQIHKRPPASLLGAACRRLALRGIVPLVVWGPGEQEDARAVSAAAGGPVRLAPPTDLATLAGLLANARLFVGGDSGPLHLACASGCPVVGLYGPTDPEVNGPWGVPHVALCPAGLLYTGVRRHDRRGGFAGLSGEMVERAIDELLDRTA